MIDFHTHILPSMDDGSRSIRESLDMLAKLKKQGIEKVIATSHFYANEDTPAHFLRRRDVSIKKLRASYVQEIPEIILGAEVYYFPGISYCEEIRNLVIEGSDLLLLEMPYGNWNEQILLEIEALSRNLEVRVVIAHIDRYYAHRRNRKYIQKLLNMDVLIQVNIDSFLIIRSRGLMLKLLRENRIDCLGSDCHNMSKRSPKWDEFYKYISKKKLQHSIEGLGSKVLLQ